MQNISLHWQLGISWNISFPSVYNKHAYTILYPSKKPIPFAAEQQQLTRVELHNDTTRGTQIRPFVPTWAEGTHPESIFWLKKIDFRQ